jgi:3-isopropylmalate/(R)-2-methylmalate dehydratase large subunit
MTIAEKILAEKSGRERVRPGDIVTCRIDRLMLDSFDHELCEAIDAVGLKRIKYPERVVVIHDHEVPPSSAKVATMYAESRRRVHRYGLLHFYDMGNHGICHQFFVENGYALPGQLILGNDSHTTTYGAMNAASRGILQEVVYVLATGRLWFRVPETVRIVLSGRLGPFVTSKDLVFLLARTYGVPTFLNKALEFAGPALASLSVASRMVLNNMAVDLGAKFAITEFDAVTSGYLSGRAVEPYTPVSSDADASVRQTIDLDLSEASPLVACPDELFKIKPARALAGTKIDQAFLGTCTNGRYEDMQTAANILRGNRIAKHVRMIVTPASQAIFLQMAKSGLMEDFVNAGAIVTNSTCGACMGLSMGLLGDGETCISSGSRNFRGRMGSARADIYLASPATVAASAIAGEIVDPGEIGRGN